MLSVIQRQQVSVKASSFPAEEMSIVFLLIYFLRDRCGLCGESFFILIHVGGENYYA